MVKVHCKISLFKNSLKTCHVDLHDLSSRIFHVYPRRRYGFLSPIGVFYISCICAVQVPCFLVNLQFLCYIHQLIEILKFLIIAAHQSVNPFESTSFFLSFNITNNNCVPLQFFLFLMLLLSHIIYSEKTENQCFMNLCFKLQKGIREYKTKYNICLIFIYLFSYLQCCLLFFLFCFELLSHFSI